MTEDLVRRTQDFFKEKYGKELSEEEAKLAMKRVTGYFRMLEKWKRREEETGKDLVDR